MLSNSPTPHQAYRHSASTLFTEFDLYIDESGLFLNLLGESSQGFASQLAGILAPRGRFDAKKVQEVLKLARAAGGLPLQGELHGKEFSAGPAYNALVAELFGQLSRRGVQPVRLVNDACLDYGERTANYTNAFAELIIRVCQKKYAETGSRIILHVVGDRVRLTGQDGDGYMPINQYLKRLEEHLACAAVRNGFTDRSIWDVRLDLQYANCSPQLQVADVVSNASHGDFRKLGAAAGAIRSAFSRYDFALAADQLFATIDSYLERKLFGPALRLMAERVCTKEHNGHSSKPLGKRLLVALRGLSMEGTAGRDAQLNLLAPWLEQLVNDKRELDFAARTIRWLLNRVVGGLRKSLGSEEASVDWFEFVLRRWALSCCNHQGDLAGARIESNALEGLMPSLASQWEHASLLMAGLNVQAIHYTDSFEHERACASLELVCGYYEQLSGLFNLALPSVFPERIRSRQRAKALGSWVQAEMKAALRESGRFERARRLSDLAMEEFGAGSDFRRQQQYRCELETYAGNFEQARSHLAASLELPDTVALGALMEHVLLLETGRQGFVLLHLLRMGAEAAKRDAQSFWGEFKQGTDSRGVLQTTWALGEAGAEYPQHGVLRHTAVVRAAKGQWKAAEQALQKLQFICRPDGPPLLVAIELAARAEVAAVSRTQNDGFADELLNGRRGLRARLDSLLEKNSGLPCSFLAPFEECRQHLVGRSVGKWGDLERALFALAANVPY